jgi:hypothetical protein
MNTDFTAWTKQQTGDARRKSQRTWFASIEIIQSEEKKEKRF